MPDRPLEVYKNIVTISPRVGFREKAMLLKEIGYGALDVRCPGLRGTLGRLR